MPPTPISSDEPSARIQRRRARPRAWVAWANGAVAGFSLYMFVCAINVMGAGLKSLGKSTTWLENILANADNPFIALMGSVLVTAIVQSSSFTTSLIITLVAAGELKLETAVFCVMGANIGTSVTNILAALGSIRIRRQFRRAFSAALVHDIFNWLTVAILFPMEWITGSMSADGHGWLTRTALAVARWLGLEPIENPNSPIRVLTRPVVSTVKWIMDLPTMSEALRGGLTAILGLTILLVALYMMVRHLKGALLRHIERLFSGVFFRNDATAYSVGAVTTVLVQSSSVTTSLIVPLAAAGAVKLKRVYPYTLGANLGTTVTGVIAASANPVLGAVTVAVSHVLFNAIGTLIWYPLGRVPIGIARWYGRLASRSKRFAFLFLFLVFVVIPGAGILITEIFFS